MLSTAGLTCCRADTSFLFSPSRVNFSVNGFKNGTGAFDLVMPNGLTGFLGILQTYDLHRQVLAVQSCQRVRCAR